MKNTLLFFVNLLLLFSCKDAVIQKIKSETIIEIPEEYIIPFLFENNRIYIEGAFKDSTHYFILDNGAMVTCLSESLFQQDDTAGLRIPDILPFPKYNISIDIKLNDYDLDLNEITIANVSRFKSKKERNVAGIIGVELFANRIIELNFENSLMTIRNKIPENINEYQCFDMLNLSNCTYWFDSLYRRIAISGFYDYSGNSYEGNLTLDLGTPFVWFAKTIKEKTDFNLSEKDTATIVAFILRNHLVADINAETFIEEKFADGILGTNFFSKFHVIFDYHNSKLYLKRNNLK